MDQQEAQRELQEKLMFYQLLQANMETMKEQAVLLQHKFVELESARQAVEDIQKAKQLNDTLIPLGSGIYMHGRITEGKKMLVDVGAGVLLNKDMESSLEVIEDKKKEIEAVLANMQDNMGKVVNKMNEIGMELQSLLQKGK